MRHGGTGEPYRLPCLPKSAVDMTEDKAAWKLTVIEVVEFNMPARRLFVQYIDDANDTFPMDDECFVRLEVIVEELETLYHEELASMDLRHEWEQLQDASKMHKRSVSKSASNSPTKLRKTTGHDEVHSGMTALADSEASDVDVHDEFVDPGQESIRMRRFRKAKRQRSGSLPSMLSWRRASTSPPGLSRVEYAEKLLELEEKITSTAKQCERKRKRMKSFTLDLFRRYLLASYLGSVLPQTYREWRIESGIAIAQIGVRFLEKAQDGKLPLSKFSVSELEKLLNERTESFCAFPTGLIPDSACTLTRLEPIRGIGTKLALESPTVQERVNVSIDALRCLIAQAQKELLAIENRRRHQSILEEQKIREQALAVLAGPIQILDTPQKPKSPPGLGNIKESPDSPLRTISLVKSWESDEEAEEISSSSDSSTDGSEPTIVIKRRRRRTERSFVKAFFAYRGRDALMRPIVERKDEELSMSGDSDWWELEEDPGDVDDDLDKDECWDATEENLSAEEIKRANTGQLRLSSDDDDDDAHAMQTDDGDENCLEQSAENLQILPEGHVPFSALQLNPVVTNEEHLDQNRSITLLDRAGPKKGLFRP